MKKWLLVFGLFILFVGAFIFINKLYYPSLPIENISKKEVIKKVNNSDEKIVKLTIENGYEWYIVRERNTSIADVFIKTIVSQHGWTFSTKDGSGLFFKKNGENLIVITQKWTGDYLLVKIPTNMNE